LIAATALCGLCLGLVSGASRGAPTLAQANVRVVKGTIRFTPASSPAARSIGAGKAQALKSGDHIDVPVGSEILIRLLSAPADVRGPFAFTVPSLPTSQQLATAHRFVQNTQRAGRERGGDVMIRTPEQNAKVDPSKFSVFWMALDNTVTARLELSIPREPAGVVIDHIPWSQHQIDSPALGAWLATERGMGYTGPFLVTVRTSTGDTARVVFYCGK
jgi:hypothetical protein